MERLNCLFPGVDFVQYIEPDLSETTVDGGTTIIYDRFTEGLGLNPETGAMDVEVPVYIRKTTIIVEGNVTTIRKQKTYAKWSERETATYVGENNELKKYSVR